MDFDQLGRRHGTQWRRRIPVPSAPRAACLLPRLAWKVRIGEQRNFSAGLQHAVAHAEPLSTISAVGNQPQLRNIFSVVVDRGCRVGGSVIHDDDFRAEGPGPQIRNDAIERFRKAMFLIKGRDDDGEVQWLQFICDGAA